MDDKFYLKKFIRDDGETLSLDGSEILLAEDNELLVQADPATTEVEYTEQDGGEMIRQRITISEQTINGLIVPKNTSYMTLRAKLSGFFQFNHEYKLVYKQRNGEMFVVHDCWISAGFQAPPQPYEEYSPWTITFRIGSPYWQQYSEDSSGNETYTNIVTLPLLSAALGGEVWEDSKLPVISDLTYMQDFTKYDSDGIQAIVDSMELEQVYTLKDSRDQQDYKISKLKSGQVLMAEDLRIQNYKCTPEDTDITEGVFQIPASTPGNYPSGSTAETIALRVEEDTAYYSWAAATAGCKPADGDAKISIMPKGWTLPTRNDWLKLLQSYPTKENIMAEPVPSIKAVSYWDGNGINQALKNSVYRWASTISEDNKAGNPDFLICGDSAPYVRGQNPIGNGFAIRGILKGGVI